MPAARKPLPEGFELHPTNSQQVRCMTCYESNPAGSADMNIDDFALPDTSIRPSLMNNHNPQGSLPLWGYLDMENTRTLDPETERKNIQHQFDQILINELFSNDTAEEDGSETNIIEALNNCGLDDEPTEEFNTFNTTSTARDSDYFPYPNKLMMLLDLINNLPRLHLSAAHFKLILWLLRDSGVPNVPSYYTYQKMKVELQTMCGSEPQPCKSTVGNYFYVNDPRDAVKKNFANPHVVKHMNYYPEEVEGPISEVWQAKHHMKYHPSKHTPMLSSAGKQFYIDEVARLSDNCLVIPKRWLKQKGIICADAHSVMIGHDGKWEIQAEIISVSSELFKYTYLDIEPAMEGVDWKECLDPISVPKMPNPDRKLVPDGYDLYDVFIPLWADDVSGNKSKQYNKHINMYTVSSNLPGRLLHQEYFVQFVSTSPNATSPEQFSAIKDMIKQMCGARLHVPSLPADNPQQAEEACHAGGNSNLLCRKCNLGVACSAAQTRERLASQLKAATLGVKSDVIEMQRKTGTKDKVAQYWINILLEKLNKMKKESPDLSADEITTILEAWLDEQPGDKINPLLDIAVRLQSTDLDGLTVPPLRAAYMMQYNNNLIRKHFKTLMQTMAFHVHDMVTPAQFQLIKSVGELGAMLWIHEINDMELYVVRVILSMV
ncbi:hypothetical protein EV359DRAFT_68107 [Lentinula novae-zelandiae]|nr:hypothetical protein EV359DRAFT_68107 [Lentinula novae-zelandiae]